MKCQIQKIDDVPLLDNAIIKDIQWAQDMWTALQSNLHRCFLYWCNLVLEIGENENVVKGWSYIFLKTYEDTCLELLSNMEVHHNTVLSKNQQLWQDLQQLSQTLQTNVPILGDLTRPRQLTLHQEKHELKKHINEFQNLIQVRCTEVNKLNEKQLDVCTSLGMEPKILKDNPLPLPEEIEEFQNYIVRLETKKSKRLERFHEVREELLSITKELKRNPSTEFEKSVLSLTDSEFLITDENMIQLEILRKALISQQKDVKEEIVNLWKKLEDYWNLLDIDLIKREDFQKNHIGNSLDVLQSLQTEIKYFEEFKKENLKVCTEKLRNQLEQLWEKCHCSQEMRKQFEFSADCHTLDLLEFHETEIKKWKQYFEENKELLTLLEKHQHLWNRMIDLDENASGPNRYNNRGGQLLKEEKERNKLAKRIPQIEETLYDLATKFKEYHNGATFTTFGRSLPDYLATLHKGRENAKKEKLIERKRQQKQSSTPLKTPVNLSQSISRNALHSDSPLSFTKRKISIPLTEETKKLKDSNIVRNIKKNSVTPDKRASARNGTNYCSSDRKKHIERTGRTNPLKKRVHSSEILFSDYGEFQNELSSKSDVPSGFFPNETTPPMDRTLMIDPNNDLMKQPDNVKYSKS